MRKSITGALNVRVPIFFSHLSERVKILSLFCLSSPIFNSKKWSFPFYVILSYTTGELIHWGDEKKIGCHKFSLNPFKLIADNQNEMKGKTTKMPADDNFPAIFTRLYTYKWIYFFFRLVTYFMSSLSFRMAMKIVCIFIYIATDSIK